MKALHAVVFAIFLVGLTAPVYSEEAEADPEHAGAQKGQSRPAKGNKSVKARFIQAVNACAIREEGEIADPPSVSVGRPKRATKARLASRSQPSQAVESPVVSQESPSPKQPIVEKPKQSADKLTALNTLFQRCIDCHGGGAAAIGNDFQTATLELEGVGGSIDGKRALNAALTKKAMIGKFSSSELALLKEWKDSQ